MHEARAIAEVLRAAEAAAQGRELRSVALRIEGNEHLTPQVVRAHIAALAARTHPDLEVVVEVDLTKDEPGLRLISVGVD